MFCRMPAVCVRATRRQALGLAQTGNTVDLPRSGGMHHNGFGTPALQVCEICPLAGPNRLLRDTRPHAFHPRSFDPER